MNTDHSLIAKDRKTLSFWQQLEMRIYRLQFSRGQQLAFLEDLASLIEDGVPLNQAAETIRDASEGVQRIVAKHIVHALAQGQLLADGLTGWLPSAITEVVRAGESSGSLAKALYSAAASFKQHNSVVSALLAAALYPLVVIILAMVVTVFIHNSVLVNFAKIKPLATWPAIGQHLYALGSIFQQAWWLAILFFIATAIFINYLLKHYTGSARHFIDRVPLLSLYRQAIAARLMQTMGLLMANGVVLKTAFGILLRGAEPYLAWHIALMENRLSGGRDNVADVLDTELINRSDLLRLKVIARSKGFDKALLTLGNQAAARNATAMIRGGKLFGGAMLVLGAILAATIIIGIYTVGSSLAT
ncbi:MAG: type II secretion system F family protein [Gammaproteobacteria bacterium]|nr:type II secretion system F family protein [Gammaproteobacteria bacterium]